MASPTLIRSVAELEPLIAASRERPVLLFKHSLTCPISSAAHAEYQAFLADRDADDGAEYALVEIQNARDVSTAVAERCGVRHESPQAILLRDGEAVWNASHWSINRQALAAALEQHGG